MGFRVLDLAGISGFMVHVSGFFMTLSNKLCVPCRAHDSSCNDTSCHRPRPGRRHAHRHRRKSGWISPTAAAEREGCSRDARGWSPPAVSSLQMKYTEGEALVGFSLVVWLEGGVC
jgi:hypothetical protein